MLLIQKCQCSSPSLSFLWCINTFSMAFYSYQGSETWQMASKTIFDLRSGLRRFPSNCLRSPETKKVGEMACLEMCIKVI